MLHVVCNMWRVACGMAFDVWHNGVWDLMWHVVFDMWRDMCCVASGLA